MANQKSKKRTRKGISFKTLSIDSVNYRTKLTDKFINRKEYVEKDIRKVEAFIPGKILKIQVKEGQGVNEGDTILILEAMKMNNKIMSPMEGKIKKIYVKEDEVVPKNHLLIELE
jgi:pyruvate carboxylase